MKKTIDIIQKYKFILILRNIDTKYCKEAVEALYKGGIRIFEVTFNPSDKETINNTKYIISQIYDMYGDEVSVGAGTVLNIDYAKAAYEAGVKFIVSPCTDPDIINYTKKMKMVSIPGAYTPTEIMQAYNLGADIVKIFPVTPDNIAYLKNVVSPLSHIPFIPTGGVNPNTINEFLACGATAVAAGATIITNELAENRMFSKITENVKKHLEKINSI